MSGRHGPIASKYFRFFHRLFNDMAMHLHPSEQTTTKSHSHFTYTKSFSPSQSPTLSLRTTSHPVEQHSLLDTLMRSVRHTVKTMLTSPSQTTHRFLSRGEHRKKRVQWQCGTCKCGPVRRPLRRFPDHQKAFFVVASASHTRGLWVSPKNRREVSSVYSKMMASK